MAGVPAVYRGRKGSMLTYDELNTQNDTITELTNVLSVLLEDRFLCDSSITQELFFRYVDRVVEHLELTDRRLYPPMLANGDSQVTNTANRFMGGSKEIKRIFSSYQRKWCGGQGKNRKNKELVVGDFDEFTRETHEMFEMVLDRIQDEQEHLYPMLRKITGDQKNAA